MTRGRPRRKSDQKGVEAIFSSPKRPNQVRRVFGWLAVFTGVCFIIVSLFSAQSPSFLSRSPSAEYGSLEFASMGVFVLTCGAGIVMSGIQLSRAHVSKATLGDNNPISSLSSEEVRHISPGLSNSNLTLALIAFLQGIILLFLYTGLVEEYQSNPTMQAWVRSSFDSAQYLLNWGALLVSSFLVGILVVYCLVTKDLGD